MQSRPVLVAALAALGLLAISAALFWPASEEERLRRATLAVLACPGFDTPAPSLLPYVAHVERCLSETVAEPVHIVVPEAGGTLPSTAAELARAAAPLVLTRSAFQVDVLDLDVKVSPPEVVAQVRVDLGDREWDGERTLRLAFVKRDGEFLLREVIATRPE
ncbi:MAG TPA: hypothetical protein VLC09_20775 [Polyangiaceae bacterium]|nr:hypothetical protein [Polyangiaceae bacterium]